MKKLLLFAVVAVFGFSNVNAQGGEDTSNDTFTGGFNKGDIYLSGALGFSSTSQDEVKSSSFMIMPSVGFLVTDNISVGLQLGYMSGKAENGVADTRDDSSFSVMAYGSYFFTPQNRFSPFAGIGAGYSSTTYNLDADDYSSNGIRAGVFGGANFWLSDCFAIFTQLGVLSYSTDKADFDGAEARNTFALNLDLKEVSFGAKYRF